MEETITISKKEYEQLLEDQKLLQWLQCAGSTINNHPLVKHGVECVLRKPNGISHNNFWNDSVRPYLWDGTKGGMIPEGDQWSGNAY